MAAEGTEGGRGASPGLPRATRPGNPGHRGASQPVAETASTRWPASDGSIALARSFWLTIPTSR